MKNLLKSTLLLLTMLLTIFTLGSCFVKKASEFTVKFQYPDGEVIETQTVKNGYAATAPEVKDKIDGVPFLKWDKDFSKVTEDLTVTAIYEFPSYTVSFDTKGGTVIEEQKVRYGQLPIKPEDPEKPGFTFSKWYEDADFTIECKFDKAFDSNTTIYAHFINDYTWISNVADFDAIRVNPSAKYILANDIDFTGVEWTPIETFSGVLDGNGYRILNLNLSSSDTYLGLIDQNEGLIADLDFENLTIIYIQDFSSQSNAYCGVIVARNAGKIVECNLLSGSTSMSAHTPAKTRTAFMGGITGSNTGTISKCTNDIDMVFNTSTGGSALLYSYMGGIAGNSNGVIEKTKMTGNITHNGGINSSNHIEDRLGGIVGINNTASALISECYVDSVINATFNATNSRKLYDVGLLTSYNYGTVINCYATGTTSVETFENKLYGSQGGAIGYGPRGKGINIFVDANIIVNGLTDDHIGAIIGGNELGYLEKSIYNGNVTIEIPYSQYSFITGSIVGTINDCYFSSESTLTANKTLIDLSTAKGICKPLSELQSAELIYKMLGWSEEIWQVNEGENPTLKCFSE